MRALAGRWTCWCTRMIPARTRARLLLWLTRSKIQVSCLHGVAASTADGHPSADDAALTIMCAPPDVQKAMVANQASFVSSAQTSNADVTQMTNDEYSDVESFEKIKQGTSPRYPYDHRPPFLRALSHPSTRPLGHHL